MTTFECINMGTITQIRNSQVFQNKVREKQIVEAYKYVNFYMYEINRFALVPRGQIGLFLA